MDPGLVSFSRGAVAGLRRRVAQTIVSADAREVQHIIAVIHLCEQPGKMAPRVGARASMTG